MRHTIGLNKAGLDIKPCHVLVLRTSKSVIHFDFVCIVNIIYLKQYSHQCQISFDECKSAYFYIVLKRNDGAHI